MLYPMSCRLHLSGDNCVSGHSRSSAWVLNEFWIELNWIELLDLEAAGLSIVDTGWTWRFHSFTWEYDEYYYSGEIFRWRRPWHCHDIVIGNRTCYFVKQKAVLTFIPPGVFYYWFLPVAYVCCISRPYIPLNISDLDEYKYGDLCFINTIVCSL